MKPIMIVGIVLVILGIAGVAFQGVSYTTREKVIDIGDIEVTAETRKELPLPLILGGVALVGGIAVVVIASKQKA